MNTDANAELWQLTSFPLSNDCDLTRWVLNHYRIRFVERMHTVPFVILAAKRAGGTGTFPYAVKEGEVLNGFDEVFDRFEPEVEASRRLLPEDPAERDRVSELWKGYHSEIGYGATRWAYSYLLQNRSSMVPVLSDRCPWYGRLWVWLAYPLVKRMIKKGLGVDENTPKTAMPVILETFDRVDEVLADGREFLVGTKATIADFGFAAMAMPVLWPPQYGGALPPLDSTPEEVREMVEKMRKRPAGKFAMRMYREHYPVAIAFGSALETSGVSQTIRAL